MEKEFAYNMQLKGHRAITNRCKRKRKRRWQV